MAINNERDSLLAPPDLGERMPLLQQKEKLRATKFGKWYYSSYAQVLLAGLVNFLSIGMYNVLTSLGGAGQLDPTTADDSNTILYCLFAATSLVAGAFVNFFGPRWCLCIGAMGFALYGGSFWSYNHNGNKGFVLFAGAASGFSAGLLWTACGTIMMAYPTEAQKGRFVSLFFFLSFLGAVVGGIIPVAQNYNNTNSGSVSDGTYAGLTILMVISCGVSLLLASPENVVRSDGTRVLVKNEREKRSFIDEIKGTYSAINKEKWILWFLPFSFSCLFYAAYQTNDFNAYFFNVRTRSINGLLYGISQLIGSVLIGIVLDMPFLKRSKRAQLGWAIMFITIFVVSLLGYFPMKESKRGVPYDPPLDISDGAKAAKYIALYFFFGFQDGMSQGYSFWIMGTLSNDPRVLSVYSGLFKVFGAMASAIAFGMDSRKVPYVNMYASYWAVSLVGCLCLIPLIFMRVDDGAASSTAEPEEDPDAKVDDDEEEV